MATGSYDVPPEPEPALGMVVESERGSLPFALIHGESLVACASWALGDAGVTTVDVGTTWVGVVESGEAFVLHDSLCPMTPTSFIAACIAQAQQHAQVVVGVLPVTDTIKAESGGFVGATIDRDSLFAVVSPIVLPATVVAALDDYPPLDFAALVTDLRARFPLAVVEAPASARRVASLEDVQVLEALGSPSADK
jgi:2-C-methyl-D-erythritol 4-phosphate cytidylyltransferase